MRTSMLFLPAIAAIAFTFSPSSLRADDVHKHHQHQGADHATAAEPVAPTAPEKPAKPYPLKNCIVSDEELGSMGKPVVFTHEGQEIKLCCKSCRKDFDKDPAKYLKKLEPKK